MPQTDPAPSPSSEPTTQPAPPYEGVPLPERFRTVAFDDLPMGMRRRVERFTARTAGASK